MNRQKIIEKVIPMRDSIWKLQEEVSSLLAELREEEVIESLPRRTKISTAIIQREFDMGYSTASMLLDNLVEKGLLSKNKSSNGSTYSINSKQPNSFTSK